MFGSNQRGYTAVALLVILLWITAIVGWIGNVVQVVHAASDPITGVFILKCIGIVVAPLGSVLGIFGFF